MYVKLAMEQEMTMATVTEMALDEAESLKASLIMGKEWVTA